MKYFNVKQISEYWVVELNPLRLYLYREKNTFTFEKF